MIRKLTLLTAAISLVALAGLSTGCQKLRARDQLNRGVKAFRNADYPTAVEHFKRAVDLDPTFQTSRLYLAMAYFSQYIPGAESPENQRMADAAEAEFLKVLDTDPKNAVAIETMASLYYNQATGVADLQEKLKRLDRSKEWYQKLIQVDPQNKVGHYSIGVIAFLKYYPAVGMARADLNMPPEDLGPLKDRKIREKLRGEYQPVIDEGIQELEAAVKIDEQYDDAMAYLNLLYRHGAALSESDGEYKDSIKKADDWLDRTMETKRKKAEASGPIGGITMEQPSQ